MRRPLSSKVGRPESASSHGPGSGQLTGGWSSLSLACPHPGRKSSAQVRPQGSPRSPRRGSGCHAAACKRSVTASFGKFLVSCRGPGRCAGMTETKPLNLDVESSVSPATRVPNAVLPARVPISVYFYSNILGTKNLNPRGRHFPQKQLLFFLGPHSWRMEVPRLGVESELQPPATSHNNARCKPCLRPTPQLTATPGP